MLLTQLEPGDAFPRTSLALKNPNGLLAVGGDLSSDTLLSAYRRGIFPWFEAPQPILWWSPDPRSVLVPKELHVSRSLRRTLRRGDFHLTVDQDFETVMQCCAAPRRDEAGTWIGDDMFRAYSELHRLGHAHSLEVRDRDGVLLGGLYGIAQGRAFFGESMFSRASDASKVALVALCRILLRGGGDLLDCQVENGHLNSLGARNISRLDFEQRLAQTVDKPADSLNWTLPGDCGDLL